MNIKKADESILTECVRIFETSTLNQYYRRSRIVLEYDIKSGFQKEQIYVGLQDDAVVGFIRYSYDGTFGKFPFLDTIIVDKVFENRGYGSMLMEFMEKDILRKKKVPTKVFLTVIEQNARALQFYLSRGYEIVCHIDDLYKKNVNEIILMKKLML